MAERCSNTDGVAAIFDAMFHGVSLQSLLLDHEPPPLHHHHPHLPMVSSDYTSSQLPPLLGFSDQCPLSYSSFDDFESSSSVVGVPTSSSRSVSLKIIPKQELLCNTDDPRLMVDAAYKPPPPPPLLPGASSRGSARVSKPKTAASRKTATSRSYSNLVARQRRRRINEKMTCLKKLMPWNRRMDTATLLEEAHNYILFLEAQVSALYAMPAQAATDDPPPLLYHPPAYDQVKSHSALDAPTGCGVGVGSSEVLDGGQQQQQTLQMLVNSSVAQTVLYSQGQYVVSSEQLDLQKATSMTFDTSSSPLWSFY